MSSGIRRRVGRFSLGGEQAEADPLLRDSFFETSQYLDLATHDNPKCFIIGRTGVGKSAMLQQIIEDHSRHAIRVSPEDLSLPHICDSGAIRTLKENEVHLAPFFIALWKHIFLVEIIRHRYSVKSSAAKQTFMATLRARVSQDRSKLAALDYLNEFQDRFWCETDERVREITDKFEQQVKAQGEIGHATLGGKIAAESGALRSSESKTELIRRYQRIVNETQLPRLNKMISVLDEDILDDDQNPVWIVIDDLDRDWVDESLANDLILSLFRAVIDLKRVRNLKILVALRTNMLQELDFAGRIGGQEEKFRSLTMHLRWSQEDLERMLDARVQASAARIGITDLRAVRGILPNRNPRRGDPFEFVIRRTMMRPRDAISYLNMCCELSGGGVSITWEHLESAEQPYSNNRLLALRDEWKPSYPGLERIFQVFSSSPTVMSPDVFLRRLEEVSLLLASAEFSDREWLMRLLRPVWEGSTRPGREIEAYRDFIELLFDVGFIGVRQATPKAVFVHDQPELLRQHYGFASIASYIVHPTFWAGLGIRRRDDVL